MGFAFSLFVIISTLIVFLSLYYFYVKSENKLYKKRPSPIDMEMAEEFNISDYSWKEKELKYKYNKTFIRNFSCNPNTIFCYWEVNDAEYYQNQQILRLYQDNTEDCWEINLEDNTDNWYLQGIKANTTYHTTIGYRKNGKFVPLAISGAVRTPPKKPSNIIDKRWQPIFEKNIDLTSFSEKASLSHLFPHSNCTSNYNKQNKIKKW